MLNRRRWIMIVLLVAVTVLIHARAIGFGFCVCDDQHQIVHNTTLNWHAAPGYFVKDVWNFKDPQYRNYYRPLFLVWLLVNFKALALHAAWWHVTSLLLHAAVVVQVYLLALRLLRNDWLAAVSAWLFAAHPAHVESVVWLSGVTEPLVAVFFLGSLLTYLRWRESGKTTALAACGALTLLALLCKEPALAGPVLIASYEWLFPRAENSAARLKGVAQAAWLPLAAVAVYFVLRVNAVRHVVAPSNPALPVLWSAPGLLLKFLGMLCWPSGLAFYHADRILTAPSLVGFWLPLAVLVALAGLVWRMGDRMIAFCALGLVLPLLPVLMGVLTFPHDDIVHDRYTYLSSIFLALLAGYVLGRLPLGNRTVLNRPAVVMLPLAPICLLAALTAVQVEWWQSGLSLFTRAVDVAPENIRARNLLANEYFKAGAVDRALSLYARTLELDPNKWETNFSAGVTLASVGQLAQAEALLRRSTEEDPTMALGFAQLADVLRAEGKNGEAQQVLQQGLLSADGQKEMLRERLGK
ncbi:MAG: tetratricopeptide repeat protein [Acidobacteriota bacterium]|nr:tetratricopeptide repeat protein [Acidobacteriota bacterium]